MNSVEVRSLKEARYNRVFGKAVGTTESRKRQGVLMKLRRELRNI